MKMLDFFVATKVSVRSASFRRNVVTKGLTKGVNESEVENPSKRYTEWHFFRRDENEFFRRKPRM